MALTDIMGQVVRCVEQNSTLSVGAQKKDSEEEIGNESMTHLSHQLLVNLASSDTNCLYPVAKMMMEIVIDPVHYNIHVALEELMIDVCTCI